jgi:hypothetical protein
MTSSSSSALDVVDVKKVFVVCSDGSLCRRREGPPKVWCDSILKRYDPPTSNRNGDRNGRKLQRVGEEIRLCVIGGHNVHHVLSLRACVKQVLLSMGHPCCVKDLMARPPQRSSTVVQYSNGGAGTYSSEPCA